MITCTRHVVTGMALLVLSFVAQAGDDDAYLASLDSLAPDARYRQLSLMLLVSDGTDDALIEALEQRAAGDVGEGDIAEFNFDDYTTPLIRIVDQQSMLAGATRLFRFTHDHAPAIAARLERMRQDHPDAVSAVPGAVPRGVITEDAIIIRNAIADSIDYAEISAREAASAAPTGLSRTYRERTIYLRNNLEYRAFAAELDRITQEALASVGGQTDAYERMFDAEVDTTGLDRKIEAAEYVYGWDREFDERAARLAEEILENIWDRESPIDP